MDVVGNNYLADFSMIRQQQNELCVVTFAQSTIVSVLCDNLCVVATRCSEAAFAIFQVFSVLPTVCWESPSTGALSALGSTDG